MSFKNLLLYITTHPYTVYVIHPCHDKWTSYITVLPYVVCVIIHAMVINSLLSYIEVLYYIAIRLAPPCC